jgi:hypothetical protein
MISPWRRLCSRPGGSESEAPRAGLMPKVVVECHNDRQGEKVRACATECHELASVGSSVLSPTPLVTCTHVRNEVARRAK